MKYVLSSKNWGVLLIAEYREEGTLKELKIPQVLEQEQLSFLLSGCTTVQRLEALVNIIKSKDKSIKLEEVEVDLSFDSFWEAYAYKKGKKARVKRKWESMEEEEQLKAISYIKKYNFFLAERPHMERKYPETYLNAEEWNN